MKTTPWTIEGAFGLIGEIFDELSHAYRAWKAVTNRKKNYNDVSWNKFVEMLE